MSSGQIAGKLSKENTPTPVNFGGCVLRCLCVLLTVGDLAKVQSASVSEESLSRVHLMKKEHAPERAGVSPI